MRDREDRARREDLAHHRLQQRVRLDVHVCSALVHHEQAAPAQDRAREAEQLALADGERATALADRGVQALVLQNETRPELRLQGGRQRMLIDQLAKNG